MMSKMSAMAMAEMRAPSAPPSIAAAIPFPLPFPLYPYQQEGVERLRAWGYRGILADDMGLGKTRQAIAVIAALAPLRVLILCPAALKFNWRSEISTLLPVLTVQTLEHATDMIDATANVIIVSYTLSIRMPAKLLALSTGLLIADESHALKSPTSKCTKLALKIAAKIKHVLLLSGTPMARPRDLWPQIKMVAPLMFGKIMFPFQKRPESYKPPPADSKEMTFGDRYCAPRMKRGFAGKMFMDLGGSANLDELHTILTSRCMIHRRKIDVLRDLPDKTREHVVIARDPIRFQVPDDAKFGYIAQQVLALSARKIEPVTRYLREIVVPALQASHGQKLIVFGHHHELSDAIFDMFTAENISVVKYDGRTLKKQDALDTFRDRAQVAVMGVKSAGVGLNITYCDHVIFAEMLYGADEHLQAEDRCYRIGQRNNVLCQYLLYENTIDELLWALIQKKAKNASNVLHGEARGLSIDVKTNDLRHLKRKREDQVQDDGQDEDDDKIQT
jgi:SWI/SNF-related matrix-associated actin-dependent regulator 1 of chromatin subfamily A